jgi:hypothetical protein
MSFCYTLEVLILSIKLLTNIIGKYFGYDNSKSPCAATITGKKNLNFNTFENFHNFNVVLINVKCDVLDEKFEN